MVTMAVRGLNISVNFVSSGWLQPVSCIQIKPHQCHLSQQQVAAQLPDPLPSWQSVLLHCHTDIFHIYLCTTNSHFSTVDTFRFEKLLYTYSSVTWEPPHHWSLSNQHPKQIPTPPQSYCLFLVKPQS